MAGVAGAAGVLNMARKCFRCGGPGYKVLYKGLPLRMCDCGNCVFAGWLKLRIFDRLWAIDHDGYFFRYEGWYLPALVRYLRAARPGDC